jgi:anhydro-N-acetylmuramic acid kinase
MIVAGVMSGTSADGIDVAIAEIMGSGFRLRFHLLTHEHFPYPLNVRKAVLGAMNASSISVADISRLNFFLPELYSEAILKAAKRTRRKLDLIGCHGQTIYHQSEAESYLGKKLTCTWQLGEGGIVAARTGVPVVTDFRPSDMAAGGNGAPLVPFFDYVAYRHATRGRIAQNIGGIANLTAIPAGASPKQVFAFDTGPGNMLIDGCMELLLKKPYDSSGKIAAKGQILEHVVKAVMRERYFQLTPPKTTGREQFGREFVSRFMRLCGAAKKEDVIATATALTARSIAEAISRFVITKRAAYRDLIVGGGGAQNPTLMALLSEAVKPLGLTVTTTQEFGVPAEGKEALAFALLAYETWNRRPSNVPSATGAARPSVLGKISFPPA